MIRPPTRTVDLTVELRLSNDTIVDFGSVHREWLKRPTVAATVIEPVRDVSVLDITANNVTATSTPTDETAQLQINLPTSHGVDGGASITTGGAKVVRNVEPRADERYTPVSDSAKRKRGAARSRIYAQTAPNDLHQVYVAGHRVGADPDLNIRWTLARQYTWVN